MSYEQRLLPNAESSRKLRDYLKLYLAKFLPELQKALFNPTEWLDIVEIYDISLQEAGLVAMGFSKRLPMGEIHVQRLVFKVFPNNGVDPLDMALEMFLSTNPKLFQIIEAARSEQAEIRAELGRILSDTEIKEDEFVFFVDVVSKESSTQTARLERHMLKALNEVGLKTICSNFPPDADIIYVPYHLIGLPLEQVIMTIVERGLLPLSSLNLSGLFEIGDKIQDSPLSKVIDYLGKMHVNYLTHGDAYLRNWGLKRGEIYSMDLEEGIDFRPWFKKGENIPKNFTDKQEVFAHKIGSRNVIEVFESAVLEDFARLFGDIKYLGSLDYSQSMALKSMLENYFQYLDQRNLLTEELKQDVENLATKLLGLVWD